MFVILVCFVIQSLCLAAWAEIDPNDPNTIVAAKAEVKTRVEEFPAKIVELKEKVYPAGTFSEIMAARIVDVNDAAVEAEQIVDKAAEICVVEGLSIERKDVLNIALEKTTKKEGLQFKRAVTEITKIIGEDLDALDPNDPNFVTDAESHALLVSWLLEIDEELP